MPTPQERNRTVLGLVVILMWILSFVVQSAVLFGATLLLTGFQYWVAKESGDI